MNEVGRPDSTPADRVRRDLIGGGASSGEPGGRDDRVRRGAGAPAGPGGAPGASETGAEERIEGAGGQAEQLGAGVPDDAAELGEDGEAEALRTSAAVRVVEGRSLEDL